MKKRKATTRWSRNKAQKIRKRQKVTVFSKLTKRLFKRRKVFIVGTVTAFILFLLYLWLKKTFLAPRYSIQELRYDPDSVAQYNDPLLYSLLDEKVLNMNFFSFKRFKKTSILNDIKKTYPLVRKFDLRMQEDQIAFVTIRYNEPTIVFQLPENRRYASYQESLYPLWTWDSLWIDSLVIELPRYTSELPNIEWIYYRLSEERLFTVVSQILETLWSQNIAEQIYLPGWEKLFLAYKSKRLYFHLNKDIDIQLQKLVDIEENFADFGSLAVLDLWSSDDTIIKY